MQGLGDYAVNGFVLRTHIQPASEAFPFGVDTAGAAFSRNTAVVVCTQCPQGSVRLGAYEAGSALVKAGAISGFDMTTEAAVAKLSFLLSRGCNFDAIRALMEMNLRGELSK